MGARGANVQSIQNEHKVHIKFPERANKTNGNAADGEHVNGGRGGSDDESVKGDTLSPQRKRSDVILISGRKENCEAAKEALLASIPIELEVQVPFDYHRFIIGKKGVEVRELMETYDVQIAVPPSSDQSDIIRVIGSSENVQRARQGLLDKVQHLDDDKQDRALRGFEVQIHVDPLYHPKIIGKRGVIITKIRTKHDVQIQFPERNDRKSGDAEVDPTLITIVGYEKNALAAKEDIMDIVGDLDSLVNVEVQIDPRVHARIIGGRGKGIAKIMDKYHVSIRFPKQGEVQNIVTISGKEEDVDEAKDHVLNLAEEYIDDMADNYLPPRAFNNADNHHADKGNKGFHVKGAPWDASAPDTNNTEEFPSMGLPAATSAPSPTGGNGGDERSPWGSR